MTQNINPGEIGSAIWFRPSLSFTREFELSTKCKAALRNLGITPANTAVVVVDMQNIWRDFKVVFLSDCSASYSQEEQDATLKNFEKHFGLVMDSRTFVDRITE